MLNNLQFSSFDMDYADVILSSIYTLSVFDWQNSLLNKRKTFYINPECEISSKSNPKKLSAKANSFKKDISKNWIDIYDSLENKIIFAYNANERFTALKTLADTNYLTMPDFIFVDAYLLFIKAYPFMKNCSINEIAKFIGVDYENNNSYDDAYLIGMIINFILEDFNITSIPDLITNFKLNYGCFYENEKILKKYKEFANFSK